MELGSLAILCLVALLAAGMGFLLSKVSSGKKVVSLEAAIEQARINEERLEQEMESAQSEIEKINDNAHMLEQKKIRLETELNHASEQVRENKRKLDVIEQNYANLTEQKHESDKQAESNQKLLEEAKSKHLDLHERLEKEQQGVLELRQTLDSERQKLAEQGKQTKNFEVQAEQTKELVESHRNKIGELEEQLESKRKQFESLNAEYAELKTSLDEREASHQREIASFDKRKEELKKDFENLANKIFEEKGKTFTNTSQASIDSMLKPFREQIEGFQKRINEVHDASMKGNTSLNSEIKKVLDIGLKMSEDANNLTSALKGDSQQRGAWGEAQLRRTLEMSGLIEDAHYEVQSSFKDADGKQKQTDYLIKLPDGKHIIIDSKVSLIAYDRSIAAETPEEEQLALAEHVKAVRAHIDDLASKDYTNLIGMRSPSFVLMFMPIEPAYIEALKSNKDLFEYGYKKGIVLVSHTTLIPILRTVSNLWMIERSNQEAREISDKAGDIYNQVCLVAENLHKLGNTLGTVSNHYNKTVTSLVGTRGLHGKVERFQKLSNKVSKSMPAIEPAHIDFEADRLSLIVEAIEPETENNTKDESNEIQASSDSYSLELEADEKEQ